MSDSGELSAALTPEEEAVWTEAKERANRCSLALAIAFRAVEAGPSPVARLRAVPAARAAIDDVQTSRRAVLDVLAGMLTKHGKEPATIETRRRDLEAAIVAEREKLAALEKALVDEVGPLSKT